MQDKIAEAEAYQVRELWPGLCQAAEGGLCPSGTAGQGWGRWHGRGAGAGWGGQWPGKEAVPLDLALVFFGDRAVPEGNPTELVLGLLLPNATDTNTMPSILSYAPKG